MRRRKMLWLAGLVLLCVGAILAVLALSLLYQPDFYQEKEIHPGALRTQLSKEFEQKCTGLLSDILNDSPLWQASFTEAQINCYFQERFVQSGLAGTMLPEGVSDPRISIDEDVIRLGFRYGTDSWSTVISMDLKLWIAPKENNVVALQLLGLRAGMIPISGKFLMEQIGRVIQSQNKDIEVSWYRHEGNMVAVLRFAASRPRSSNQLEQLKVDGGKIFIAGRSLNAVAPVEDLLPGKGKNPVKATPAKPGQSTKQKPEGQNPSHTNKEGAIPPVSIQDIPPIPPISPKEGTKTPPAGILKINPATDGSASNLTPPALPPTSPPKLPDISLPPAAPASPTPSIIPTVAPGNPVSSGTPILPPLPRIEDVPPPPPIK